MTDICQNSYLFGLERGDALAAILGNLDQNDIGLAALALLIAELAPAQKETMIRLIQNMLVGVVNRHEQTAHWIHSGQHLRPEPGTTTGRRQG